VVSGGRWLQVVARRDFEEYESQATQMKRSYIEIRGGRVDGEFNSWRQNVSLAKG
jgi:hypothetical protein